MPQRVEEVAMKYHKDSYLTDELRMRYKYTPDWLERKMERDIPIFVYGAMKSGGAQAWALRDSPCLGEAFTSTCNYLMESAQYGDFPVVFDTKTLMSRSNRVLGECYLVDPMTLLRLDSMEENGKMFYRQQRFVFLPEQEIPSTKRFNPSVKAWIYLGKYDFWENQKTESIKTVHYLNQNLFEFDQKEYQEGQVNYPLDDLDDGGWPIPDFIRNPVPF